MPGRRQATPPGDIVPGEAESLGDQKLREASAELLLKREERGREIATALIGQVAVVGTFLGAFSLLGDTAKAAVVQSGWALVALAAAAVGLALSLLTSFLPPWKMPSLNDLTRLESFWNTRVRVRRSVLILAWIALAFAVFAAIMAFSDGRNAVAPKPSATLSGKMAPAKDTPSTLEVSASWVGLKPGENVLLCASGEPRRVLGEAHGNADNEGKQSLSLTLPIPATVAALKATTFRLAAAPAQAKNGELSACVSSALKPVGEPKSLTINTGVGGGQTAGLPPEAVRLPDGSISLPVKNVELPERLMVSGVRRSRDQSRADAGSVEVIANIADTRGWVVKDATVKVFTFPSGLFEPEPESRTGLRGRVRFRLKPVAQRSRRIPRFLVLMVRAVKPGDPLLTGVSARRLVRVPLTVESGSTGR